MGFSCCFVVKSFCFLLGMGVVNVDLCVEYVAVYWFRLWVLIAAGLDCFEVCVAWVCCCLELG